MDETYLPTESAARAAPHQLARAESGAEFAHLDDLLRAATRVFLQQGYGLASIDQIATEAGMSTRKIYERYKNKAELMAAVVTRLIDRDVEAVFEIGRHGRTDVEDALTQIGRTLMNRLADPDSAALFRIVATESQRFPELTNRVRAVARQRLDGALAAYLQRQMQRGVFVADDPQRSAALFLQMITAELRDSLLFERGASIREFDQSEHVARVVRLFLYGAAPRAGLPTSRNAQRGS
jgi:AcrR family transcriptional regulator